MAEMDPARRALLEELGYVWTAEGEGIPHGERRDPKDTIELWQEMQDAKQLVAEERFEEAETVLRAVIEQDPGAITARTVLSVALMRAGRDAEALEICRESLLLAGAGMELLVNKAELEYRLGREDWRETLEHWFCRTSCPPYTSVCRSGWPC